MTVFYRLPEDDVHDEDPAPDLRTRRTAGPCTTHDPCDCGWCICYRRDPAGNAPPVPIPHPWWHEGVEQGLVG